MTIRVAVHGAAGRMGRQVIAIVAADPQAELVAALDRPGSAALGLNAGVLAGLGTDCPVTVTSELAPALSAADVVIDFSLPAGLPELMAACERTNTAAVVGTTGVQEPGRAAIAKLSARAPVVFAPNFSIGVNVFWALARRAAELLGPDADLEIVEMHHHHKVDAPSGTAVRLLEEVAAVRGLDPKRAAVHGRHGQVGARTKDEIGVHALRGGDVVGDHTLVLAAPGERIELSHRAHGREIFARGAVRAAHWVVGKNPGLYGMDDVLDLAK